MDKTSMETEPMELETDLAEINKFVNARDLKLWKGEYTARYSKLVYDNFRKENERMDSELANIEKKIKKYEDELPKYQLLNEQMVKSITIASAVEKQLIKRQIDMENNKAMWKQKYEKLLEMANKEYRDKKRLIADDNPLYKELQSLKLEVQKLQIEEKMLDQSIINKKRILQNKKDVQTQILNTVVVSFVRSCVEAQKLEKIDKEIAEKKIILQDLLEQYKNQTKYKEQAEKQTSAKNTTMLKLPGPECFQYTTKNNELINFPTITTQTETHIPKINDASIISELKKRSRERRYQLLRKNSNINLPTTTKPVSKVPSIEENIAANQSDSQKIPAEKPYETPSKIKIIQDDVINTGLLKNNLGQVKVSRKQGANANHTGQETKRNDNKKKNKRVTFDMDFSQEYPNKISKITNVENDENIVDSQFTNFSEMSFTENNSSFLLQANDNTTGEDMFFNSKDMTHDSVFSPQQEIGGPDRTISDEDPDNTDTRGFFSWNDTSHQTSTGFDNFRLF